MQYQPPSKILVFNKSQLKNKELVKMAIEEGYVIIENKKVPVEERYRLHLALEEFKDVLLVEFLKLVNKLLRLFIKLMPFWWLGIGLIILAITLYTVVK